MKKEKVQPTKKRPLFSPLLKLHKPEVFRPLAALLLPLYNFTVIVMLPEWTERIPPHEVGGLKLYRQLRQMVKDKQCELSVQMSSAFESLVRESEMTGVCV